MKYLLLLLLIPCFTIAQTPTDRLTAPLGSIIETEFRESPAFVKLDTTYGIVSFYARGGGQVISVEEPAARIDSVFESFEQVPCPWVSCSVLHYRTVEKRKVVRIIYSFEFKELNLKKQYTFITEDELQDLL